MNYYTYLIKCNTTQKVYYGKRSSKKLPEADLWVHYFTSSKIVNKLIGLYGKNNFTYEVRRTFNSFRKMNDWEAKVLRRMDITNNTFFMNQHIPSEEFFCKSPPFKGNHHSVDVRQKISSTVAATKASRTYKRPDNVERNKKPNHNKQKGLKKPEISIRNAGSNNGNSKIIVTPKGIFYTRKDAALAYNVWDGTISEWIKKGKEGFSYG